MTQGKLFFDANRLMEDGDFIGAGNIYQQLLQEVGGSGNLHYNLGISSYRLGNIGESIFHFKKAQIMLPRDADVSFNLDYVRKQAKDKITENSNIVVRHFEQKYALNLKESAYFMTFAAVITTLLGSFILIKKSESVKWVQRFFLVLTIVTMFGTAFKYWKSDEFGVVTSKQANVFSGKSGESVLLFTLHEGAEFSIEEKDDSWLRIRLADGKRGWIKSDLIVF